MRAANKKLLLFLPIISIGLLLLLGNFNRENRRQPEKIAEVEVMGWIPWWEEEKAYSLALKNESIKSVSPVWYMVDQNFSLAEVGVQEKTKQVRTLRAAGIKVQPTLASELSREELSRFLNDKKSQDALIQELLVKLKETDADGLDLDLENIKKEDEEEFSNFVKKIHTSLNGRFHFSIAVHAQDGHLIWEGQEGQNLKEIGKIVDEVRIMIYDQHTTTTQPGPVSTLSWMKRVLKHNEKRVPKEKIVVGIPTYGYVWPDEGEAFPLQYYEFEHFLKNNEFIIARDNTSGEIQYKGKDFTAFLSDAIAIEKKVKTAQNLGYNRVILWHLGGMDERYFNL